MRMRIVDEKVDKIVDEVVDEIVDKDGTVDEDSEYEWPKIVDEIGMS